MTLSQKIPLRATQFVRRLPLSPAGVSEDAPKAYRGRPAAISARLRASRKALAESRAIVLDRDGFRCVLCGSPENVEVHHRIARGMGGASRNPEAHCPSRMITLCRRHHGFVESHREWARDVGALVPKGVTAERCPVRTPHGWVLFAPDGSRRFVNLEGETS